MTDLTQSAALDKPWLHDAGAVALTLSADLEQGLSLQEVACGLPDMAPTNCALPRPGRHGAWHWLNSRIR